MPNQALVDRLAAQVKQWMTLHREGGGDAVYVGRHEVYTMCDRFCAKQGVTVDPARLQPIVDQVILTLNRPDSGIKVTEEGLADLVSLGRKLIG